MTPSPGWGMGSFFMQRWGLFEDALPGGRHRRLDPIVDAQFVENVNDVAFDGVGADVEAGGDPGIGIPFGQQLQDLGFPGGKA